MLHRYKHMPSFQGIHSDCEAIVVHLMDKLKEQLRNPTVSLLKTIYDQREASISRHLYKTDTSNEWTNIFVPKYNITKDNSSCSGHLSTTDNNNDPTGVLSLKVPL